MRPDDEGKAFAAITRRLQLRFPRVPEQHILAAVQLEEERLAGARIRDFVPLLVERAAAQHLLDEARQPAMS